MDVEALLQGVIRFSNFMTSRLIVAGVVFYVLMGFLSIGDATQGFLPDIRLVNEVVENYQVIFDTLGAPDFALLLILFVFLTTIHIVHVLFESVGRYLPPAIVPVSGWRAVGDLVATSFDILREARGEEHSDEENQRLFEFRKSLREMEQASNEKYRERLEGPYTTFRIAKTFVLFALAAWLYAMLVGGYGGDPRILIAVFATALLVALFSALTILRSHQDRVSKLYRAVTTELIEFATLWATPEHQRRIVEVCTAEPQLRHVSLEVVLPVFGTLDALVADMRRLRRRRIGSG